VERCKACILPRSYAAVRFDAGGVCNLCAEFPAARDQERAVLEGRKGELAEIVASVRGEARDYDCIVLLSGGLDSTYVAYVLRKEFKLKLLGLNVDNGYRTSLALENMERICSKLEMDMVTLKPSPGLYRDMFAHFLRTHGYFCTVCNAFGYMILGSFVAREARRRGVKPLVVGGWSRKYEYQPGLSVLSVKSFADALQEKPELCARARNCALVEPAVYDAFSAVADIRQIASASRDTAGFALRLIQLPSYMDWDYRRIVSTLENELGWKKREKGHQAHFDCSLAPVQEYLKHRKFGFSQETIKNSVLIREGRLTRQEALAKIGLEQTAEPPELAQTISQWGLDREQISWDAEWR